MPYQDYPGRPKVVRPVYVEIAGRRPRPNDGGSVWLLVALLLGAGLLVVVSLAVIGVVAIQMAKQPGWLVASTEGPPLGPSLASQPRGNIVPPPAAVPAVSPEPPIVGPVARPPLPFDIRTLHPEEQLAFRMLDDAPFRDLPLEEIAVLRFEGGLTDYLATTERLRGTTSGPFRRCPPCLLLGGMHSWQSLKISLKGHRILEEDGARRRLVVDARPGSEAAFARRNAASTPIAPEETSIYRGDGPHGGSVQCVRGFLWAEVLYYRRSETLVIYFYDDRNRQPSPLRLRALIAGDLMTTPAWLPGDRSIDRGSSTVRLQPQPLPGESAGDCSRYAARVEAAQLMDPQGIRLLHLVDTEGGSATIPLPALR